MKFTVDQAKLNQKLQAVTPVVPAKTTLSILSNVLLSVESNELRLTATDLDLSMTATLPVKSGESGKVCVPAKRFAEIVRSLPSLEVEFSTRNNAVRIKCGKSDFKIQGADPEEYPKVPERPGKAGFEIPSDALRQMIERVIHAVSLDPSRLALTGVLWEFEKSGLTMVATDGHRLAKTMRPEKISAGDVKEVIVPGKALQQLERSSPDDGKVRVTVDSSYAMFDLGTTIIHSRLLEGPFPNYRPVIPTGNKNRLAVERDSLAQATRRVAILANTLTHQIRFGLRSDAVSLSVSTPDLGEAQEEIVADYNGPEMDIGFNASYLLDILKCMGTDDVEFSLDREDTAAVIRPVEEKGEGEFFCLLMPLRL